MSDSADQAHDVSFWPLACEVFDGHTFDSWRRFRCGILGCLHYCPSRPGLRRQLPDRPRRRSANQLRPCGGLRERRGAVVPRHPLRRAADRRASLEAADRPGAMDRHASCDREAQHLPAACLRGPSCAWLQRRARIAFISTSTRRSRAWAFPLWSGSTAGGSPWVRACRPTVARLVT